MFEDAHISRDAVAGVVSVVGAYEPQRRSPEDARWDLLLEFARRRSLRRLPTFDSKLTRETREADERRWKAAARAFAMGAYDWARLAEPTVDRFAQHARTIVEQFIEQFTSLFRRSAVATRPVSEVPATTCDLLVATLVSAACAPPAYARPQLSEGLNAA